MSEDERISIDEAERILAGAGVEIAKPEDYAEDESWSFSGVVPTNGPPSRPDDAA